MEESTAMSSVYLSTMDLMMGGGYLSTLIPFHQSRNDTYRPLGTEIFGIGRDRALHMTSMIWFNV
jgi:hypothetical protein